MTTHLFLLFYVGVLKFANGRVYLFTSGCLSSQQKEDKGVFKISLVQ
jgi:hypothetical protein